ncbi:MAG: AraC family transcriptional regulator [Clostridia bacterium]|nr:AraC family transcriptional regulator [Clostridia bacterium]
MYPKALENEPQKSYWSYDDCFSDRQLEYIHAFIHKNYSIGMHTHSFYEVNIVLRGAGMHYIENKACPAQARSVFVIPPNVRHGYYQESSLDVYHILIACDFFDRYAQELKNLPGFSILFEIEPYLRSEFDGALFLTMTEEQMEQLEPELLGLLDACEMPYAGREIIKDAKALSIIGALSNFISVDNGGETSALKNRQSRSVVKCMEYIRLHYGDKITVEALAKIAYMSRATFTRNFEDVCKCTPMEYVTAYRIRKAKELISLTDMPITQIAQECGFYDGSHFIKYFIKSEAMSPFQYKKAVSRGGQARREE